MMMMEMTENMEMEKEENSQETVIKRKTIVASSFGVAADVGGGPGRLAVWLKGEKKRRRVMPDEAVLLFLAGLSRSSESIIGLQANERRSSTCLGIRVDDPRFHSKIGIEPKLFVFVLLSSLLHQGLKASPFVFFPNSVTH